MIAKTVRGWRPGGLVAYLLGPGRHEEHRNPHLVASWDGDPAMHQPTTRSSEWDYEPTELAALIDHMEQPARWAGLPTSNPPEGHRLHGRDGYVWHTSVRLADADRTLTDGEWRDIAEHLMDRTGIAPKGDPGGCRWIAVRHADDHIHLMATLVRQDSGKRFHPKFDRRKLCEARAELEIRYGLVRTAEADQTAARCPSRGEREKAARSDRDISRVHLRRTVQQAAATHPGPEAFFEALRSAGVLVRENVAPDGRLRGYAVSRPGDLNATGEPVWFSGGQLATDLTLPKLQARWSSAPAPTEHVGDGRGPLEAQAEVLRQANAIVAEAHEAVRAASESPAGVAHATQDVLSAWAKVSEATPGPVTRAADDFDRSYRYPANRERPTSQLGPVAQQLRMLSWQMGSVGAITGRGSQRDASAALALAVASLLLEIAAWQEANNRQHQAAAARRAATSIAPARPEATSSTSPARPAVRVAGPQPAVGESQLRPKRSAP